MTEKPKKLFVIYDERVMLAPKMSTDDATVLCTASSLTEAERDVDQMFPRGVIFSYDTKGDELVNEEYEPHSKRGW